MIKRRNFIKKASIATAGTLMLPYILPSGRLFAATGNRLANHVVFVLFGGGIRNQESVEQAYLAHQGLPTQGNVMENMLNGAAPSSNQVYTRWNPVLNTTLSQQGTLFPELRYKSGPTGHYNGHTVAMTGNYTETGLNLNVNPQYPTLFEYYRKHSDPAKSALNAWWLSEGLGPYPSLNYSRHPEYGAQYGANYLHAGTTFSGVGTNFANAKSYQPDDVERIYKVKSFLDKNFDKNAAGIQGVSNSLEDREKIKNFINGIFDQSIQVDYPTPGNLSNGLTGDLINIMASWLVLREFASELTVINTFNLDICHSNFSQYLNFLHKADYGVGWLWDKIQSHPKMANDTIMICMPEHGRNLDSNSIYDDNGLRAYDHTSDENSRRLFALIAGPPGVVKQNNIVGSTANPVGESVDIVPTIAHILGFDNAVPGGLLQGRVLNEAFL
ncbi:MAG: hypothetical protein WD048_01040 [Chitinophagales bacterium]